MGFELCGLSGVLGRGLALLSSAYLRLSDTVLAFVSILPTSLTHGVTYLLLVPGWYLVKHLEFAFSKQTSRRRKEITEYKIIKVGKGL